MTGIETFALEETTRRGISAIIPMFRLKRLIYAIERAVVRPILNSRSSEVAYIYIEMKIENHTHGAILLSGMTLDWNDRTLFPGSIFTNGFFGNSSKFPLSIQGVSGAKIHLYFPIQNEQFDWERFNAPGQLVIHSGKRRHKIGVPFSPIPNK